MSRAQAQLSEWLGKLDLVRVRDTLMKELSELGIESLRDMGDLLLGESKDIARSSDMDAEEQKRFFAGIRMLRREMPWQKEQDADAMTKQQTLQKQQEELAKQLEELERQREELKQHMEQVQLPAETQVCSEIHPVEWFEVLKNLVFIKATPHKDSDSIAVVECGRRLQVSTHRERDAEAKDWVELTEWELRRCGLAPPLRGFALIDGSHLGLGPLLKGPCDPEKLPKIVPQAAEDSDEEPEVLQVPAAPQDREAVITSNWLNEFTRLNFIWATDPPRKADDHVVMSVNYRARRGVVCLFKASITRKATVQMFRAGFCSQTGLHAKWSMLMKAEPSITSSNPEDTLPLETRKTLEDYGFYDSGTVMLQYVGDFEEDYCQGCLLQE